MGCGGSTSSRAYKTIHQQPGDAMQSSNYNVMAAKYQRANGILCAKKSQDLSKRAHSYNHV
jgi:hypothetical protein